MDSSTSFLIDEISNISQSTVIDAASIPTTNSEVVSLYFEHVKINNKRCILCKKVIYAKSCDRFSSHIQNGCVVASKELKENVKQIRSNEQKKTKLKQQMSNSTNLQSPDTSITNSNNEDDMIIIHGSKLSLESKIGDFIFETGSPFNLVDSQSFKNLFTNPKGDYVGPSEKRLRTVVLDAKYEQSKQLLTKFILDHDNICLISDGWTSCSNQHIINFMVSKPRSCTYFHSSVATGSNSNTGKYISDLLISKIESIGPTKISSLVVDNAKNVKSALLLVEKKYPWIITSTCAAHAAHHLLGDVLQLKSNKHILEKSKVIVKFFKNHLIPYNEFRTLQTSMKQTELEVGEMLKLPCDTRWGTNYDCLRSVFDNKLVLTSVIHLKTLTPFIQNDDFAEVKNIITDPSFWTMLDALLIKTTEIRKAITLLESDSSDISNIIPCFSAIATNTKDKEIKNIVKERLSMVRNKYVCASYILNPVNPLDVLDQSGRQEGISVLDHHLNGEVTELINFVNSKSNLGKDESNFINRCGAEMWWNLFGSIQYPLLSKLALKLFAVPSSSASAERAWSAFGYIMNFRRNRLAPNMLEKLAGIYINSRNSTTTFQIMADIEYINPFQSNQPLSESEDPDDA